MYIMETRSLDSEHFKISDEESRKCGVQENKPSVKGIVISSSAKMKAKKLFSIAIDKQQIKQEEKTSDTLTLVQDEFMNDTSDFKEEPKFKTKSRLKLRSASSSTCKSKNLPIESQKENSQRPSICGSLKAGEKATVTSSLLMKNSVRSCSEGGNAVTDTDLATKECKVCGASVSSLHWNQHLMLCLGKQFSRSSDSRVDGTCPADKCVCQVCFKDITHLNSNRRTHHLNKCIDERTASKQENQEHQERLQKARKAVLPCPMCDKKLKTEGSRKAHLKKCAVNNKMTVDRLKKLLDQQEEEYHARLDAGLLPEEFRQTESKKSAKRGVKEPKSNLEADAQLALALSNSLSEHYGDQQNKLAVSDSLSDHLIRGKKRKRKAVESLLLSLTAEEIQERISGRVAHYIFHRSQEAGLATTPPFKSSKRARKAAADSPTVWRKSSIESHLSQDSTTPEQSPADRSRVLELEANNNPDLPGSYRSSPERHAENNLSQFYVSALMPPVTLDRVKAGSKVKRISIIPGRRKTSDKAAHVYSEEEESEEKSDSEDFPISQTVGILAELADEAGFESGSWEEESYIDLAENSCSLQTGSRDIGLNGEGQNEEQDDDSVAHWQCTQMNLNDSSLGHTTKQEINSEHSDRTLNVAFSPLNSSESSLAASQRPSDKRWSNSVHTPIQSVSKKPVPSQSNQFFVATSQQCSANQDICRSWQEGNSRNTARTSNYALATGSQSSLSLEAPASSVDVTVYNSSVAPVSGESILRSPQDKRQHSPSPSASTCLQSALTDFSPSTESDSSIQIQEQASYPSKSLSSKEVVRLPQNRNLQDSGPLTSKVTSSLLLDSSTHDQNLPQQIQMNLSTQFVSPISPHDRSNQDPGPSTAYPSEESINSGKNKSKRPGKAHAKQPKRDLLRSQSPLEDSDPQEIAASIKNLTACINLLASKAREANKVVEQPSILSSEMPEPSDVSPGNTAVKKRKMDVEASVCRAYSKLVNQPEYSDVIIVSKDGEIPAHQVILHARCPQLLKYVNSNKRMIELKNFSSSSILSVLRYIYCGDLTIADEDAHNVQVLVDAYSLNLNHLSVRAKEIVNANPSLKPGSGNVPDCSSPRNEFSTKPMKLDTPSSVSLASHDTATQQEHNSSRRPSPEKTGSVNNRQNDFANLSANDLFSDEETTPEKKTELNSLSESNTAQSPGTSSSQTAKKTKNETPQKTKGKKKKDQQNDSSSSPAIQELNTPNKQKLTGNKRKNVANSPAEETPEKRRIPKTLYDFKFTSPSLLSKRSNENIPSSQDTALSEPEVCDNGKEASRKSLLATFEKVTQASLNVTPTSLNVTSTSQNVGTTAQVVTPTSQNVTTTGQAVRSTGQVVTPTSQNVTTTGQAVRSTGQVVTPTRQNVTPTSLNVTSTSQNVGTTAQVVTPTSQNVTTTGQAVRSTGQGVTPTGQNVTPTAQAVRSTAQAVTPTAQAVRSTGQNVTPTAQAVKTTGQAVRSTGQNVTPTAQAVKTTGQAVRSTSQNVTPTAQAVRSTGQNVTPTAQAVKTTGQAVRSTGQNVTPTAQTVKTTAQAVRSTGQNVTPTAQAVKTTGQAVRSTGQNVTPTAQAVKTTGQAVRSTGQNVTPTAQAVKTTGQAVRSTGQAVTPTRLNVTPTRLNVTPTRLNVTPTSLNVTPTGLNVTPTSLNVTPTGLNVTPTGLNVTPTGLNVTPTSLNVTPTSLNVTPTSLNVTPTSLNVTPTSLNVTPTSLNVTPLTCVSTSKSKMSPKKTVRGLAKRSRKSSDEPLDLSLTSRREEAASNLDLTPKVDESSIAHSSKLGHTPSSGFLGHGSNNEGSDSPTSDSPTSDSPTSDSPTSDSPTSDRETLPLRQRLGRPPYPDKPSSNLPSKAQTSGQPKLAVPNPSTTSVAAPSVDRWTSQDDLRIALMHEMILKGAASQSSKNPPESSPAGRGSQWECCVITMSPEKNNEASNGSAEPVRPTSSRSEQQPEPHQSREAIDESIDEFGDLQEAFFSSPEDKSTGRAPHLLPTQGSPVMAGRVSKDLKTPSPFTPMLPYDNMATVELKKHVSKIGARPVGKKRMRELLKQVYQYTHQYETDSEMESTPVKKVTHQVHPSQLCMVEDLSNSDPWSDETTRKTKSSGRPTVLLADNNINLVPSCSSSASSSEKEIVDEEDRLCASQDSSCSDGPEFPEESILQGWPDEDEPGPTQRTQLSPEALHAKLGEFLSQDSELYHQILLYEPLELDVLKKQISEAGIRCGMQKLMDFLDEQCITFTMKNIGGGGRNRHQPSKKGGKGKKTTTLSQS